MIDKKKFIEMTGREPENDDLDRCNCKDAGKDGHIFCGVCKEHNQPRFICGCITERIDK